MTERSGGADAGGRRARALLRVLGTLVLAAAVAVGLVVGCRPLLPHDTRSTAPPPAAPSSTAAPGPPAAATPDVLALADLHVVLDPGHNGGNAESVAQINAPVGDGRGGTKACNTVGTSTLSGFAEHEFTWDVALRTRDLLVADGAQVTVTRDDDSSVGPCVDERGRTAGDVAADVLVSIHANGSDDPTAQGFFAIVSGPPLNEQQGEPSRRLAAAVLEALGGAGFPPSGAYPGALSERADLGTLNWAERPVVLLELAEMRNPVEAALVQTEEGRQRYAEAINAGLTVWAGY